MLQNTKHLNLCALCSATSSFNMVFSVINTTSPDFRRFIILETMHSGVSNSQIIFSYSNLKIKLNAFFFAVASSSRDIHIWADIYLRLYNAIRTQYHLFITWNIGQFTSLAFNHFSNLFGYFRILFLYTLSIHNNFS